MDRLEKKSLRTGDEKGVRRRRTNIPSSDPPQLFCKTLVLKIASRCNLNCSYCYVYNLGDTTYKDQPKTMSDTVVEAVVHRVRNHCRRHNIERFTFVFHGGEPLLAGQPFFANFVDVARLMLEPAVAVEFSIQTNGTLLTESWCKLLGRLDIGIGISLDGPKAINDLQRVDHRGAGSYDRILAGFNIAKTFSTGGTPGLLTVINPQSDPREIYQHLKDIGATSVDFLLPEATHDRLPFGKADLNSSIYADWLIAIFDIWFYEPTKAMSIRLFEFILIHILGGDPGLDSFGTGRNEVLVIESDGSIEPIGSLKVCGHGFTKLGANVATHELDDALSTPLAALYQLSGKEPCDTCKRCPIVQVCGGGYLPHRYRRQNAFDNPSIYCPDLAKLITHVHSALLDCVAKTSGQLRHLRRVTFEEVMARRGVTTNYVGEKGIASVLA